MKDLLISLCNYPYDRASGNRLKELFGKVDDWDDMAGLINLHGITALAAYNITEAGLGGMIPARTMALLEGGLRQSTVRNAWLTERWKEVNRILSGSGIRHILIKGMALEYSVYGARGLRQMNDNDILVKKEDALKAWHLLQENGFRAEILKSTLYRTIITDIGKHLPSLTKSGYSIEIHHRLFYNAEENKCLGNAIDNARAISVEGIGAYVLQDDIHADYLKNHLQMHMLSGDFQLRLYRDIQLLKPGSAIPVPESFFLKPHQITGPRQKKKVYTIHFLAVSPGNRLRYLAGDIFPSIGWLKKRHNCSTLAAILFYPRRLAKLFWLTGKA